MPQPRASGRILLVYHIHGVCLMFFFSFFQVCSLLSLLLAIPCPTLLFSCLISPSPSLLFSAPPPHSIILPLSRLLFPSSPFLFSLYFGNERKIIIIVFSFFSS
uniref:Uncharacterized protein n=1 Tax=Cacopsylla melanoneura TaxID=428564 RepID=A0A8D8S0M5_9HEMI